MVTTLKSESGGKCWDQIINKIEFAMNSTYQSTLGRSPMELIYKRKISLHGNDVKEIKEDLVQTAKNNLRKAENKMKQFEITKRGHRIFNVGDLVYVKKIPAKFDKAGDRFDGPYKIKRFVTEHQVQLETERGIINRRIEWLKLFKKGG